MRFALPILSDERYRNYFDAAIALDSECVMVGAECDPMEYHGLVLPGGGDVNPARYGRVMEPDCGVPDDALDALQLAVMDRFVAAKRPVLGTCRGHQLINVYFGGTLIQHLPQSVHHRRDEGCNFDKVHMTRAKADSFIGRLYGTDFPVNSAHHQAVDVIGADLEIVQWADDGVAEALRHKTLPVYGVQWHPERMVFAHRRDDTVDGEPLFRWFLDQCRI